MLMDLHGRYRPAAEGLHSLPLDCSTDELIDAIGTASAGRALLACDA